LLCIRADAYVCKVFASLRSSFTARPSAAYRLFVLSWMRALAAMVVDTATRNWTRGFSVSMFSGMLTVGSYLEHRGAVSYSCTGRHAEWHHTPLDEPIKDVRHEREIGCPEVLNLGK